MKAKDKTKGQLEDELRSVYRRVAQLEASEAQHKQAEEALRESQQFSASLLESSPNPVLVINPDTSIRYVNPAVEQLTGFSTAEIIGKKAPYPWWTEETLKKTSKDLTEAMRRGAAKLEELFQKKNGERFWVQITSGPVTRNGELQYYLANWVDITQRKQAEQALTESEEKYRTVLEEMEDSYFEVGLRGHITFANESTCRNLQLSREELMGASYKTFSAEKSIDDVYKAFNKAYRTGKPVKSFSWEIVRGDGSTGFAETTVLPLHNQDGQIIGFRGIGRDITERKQVEDALRASQEKFRSLVETTNDFVWEMDRHGVYIYCSPQMEKLWGFKPEEMLGKTPFDLLPPEDREQAIKGFSALSESASPFVNMEIPSFDSTGRIRFLEISGVPFFDDAGKTGGYRGITRDITERKRTEEALRQSEDKYRQLFELGSDALFLIETETGRILDLNAAAMQTYGYSREEALQMNNADFSAEPDKTRQATAQAHEDIPLRYHKKKDGSIFPTDISVAYFTQSGKEVCVAAIRDITERKRAEEALTDEATKRRILIEQSRDGIVVLDENGKVYEVNQRFAEILGYSLEEAHQLYVWDWDTQWTREQLLEMVRSVDATGDHFDTQHRRKDGTSCDVEISTNGAVFAGQKLVFCVCRDITERKQAEEAMRGSEEKYRLLVENASEAIIVVQDGALKFANPQATELSGYSKDELLSKLFTEFVHPDDREIAAKYYLATLQSEEVPRGFLLRIIAKDGNILWAEVTRVLITWEGKPAALGLLNDITERKQAEEEKRDMEQKAQVASRLATVGLLASGVGHEINNPLTAVVGYSQLLMQEDLPEDIKEQLAAINEGAQRVANIVKKLLAFARHKKPERTYASINTTMATTLDLLAHQLKTSNIEVNLQLDPDLPWTVADIGQLQQVFLNLVINAETEMRLAHGKGELSIKTEKTDNTIRVSFKDDGPGIAKNNLDKIFDPFFTTREVGEGTGLGLSICHEIMADQAGTIHAESKPGKGATFIVQLPIVTEQEEPELAEPSVEETVKVAGARILVVDDEPVILDFVSRVLTDEGHEVEIADNAEDALRKMKSQRYGLILLDIKMPGMSGTELYKRIQGIAGSLAKRVVFITGDILGAETMDFIDRTQAPCVTKPFDAEQLKKEINRILAENP